MFPAAWKQSNITPFHKGGPEDDSSNYRPISVVWVIAKILEKIVSVQLSGYLICFTLIRVIIDLVNQQRTFCNWLLIIITVYYYIDFRI